MIIDAFPFSDELDLLELRLGELENVVDKFILVETNKTYRQNPKPLYYHENRHLFKRWEHKIIHSAPILPNEGAWYFEKTQREVIVPIVRALNPLPNDTISFSDLDEIPNPEVLRTYDPGMGLRNLEQFTFYYHFGNLMNYGRREWSRARLGRVCDFYEHGAYEFRQGKRDLDHSHPSLPNAGWHGSYFNISVERMRRKVKSISHDDMDHIIDRKSDLQLAKDAVEGVDLFNRAGIGNGQRWESDDPRLPRYFLDNKDRFKMFTREHWEGICASLSR